MVLPNALVRHASPPPTAPTPGPASLVALGDSITLQLLSPSGLQGVRLADAGGLLASWVDIAAVLAGQRLQLTYNAGFPGDRTDQMLARLAADVLVFQPTHVTLLAGTNDITQSVPLATMQANYRAIVDTLLRAGIVPVICTIPPINNNTSTTHPLVTAWNAWLQAFALRRGLAVIDCYSVLVDPATGSYKSGLAQGDGIHPSIAGATAMANLFVSWIQTAIPPRTPWLVGASDDPLTLVTNGLLLSQSGGLPTGWTVATNGNGTAALGSAAAALGSVALGNALTLTKTTGTGLMQAYQTIAGSAGAGFAVGDKLAFAGRIGQTAAAGGLTVDLALMFTGSAAPAYQGNLGVGAMQPLQNWPGVDIPAGGVWYQEAIVPVGTTGLLLALSLFSGTGVVSIGQPVVLNLTRLGVL